MRALVMVVALAAASPALAHNAGCDGKPVPAHISASCCGPADYHRLDPSQISEGGAGYLVHDGGHVFLVPREKAEPSTDGCAAIFYTDNLGRDGEPIVWCFQIPFGL